MTLSSSSRIQNITIKVRFVLISSLLVLGERFDSRKLFILIYLAFRSEMLLLPTLLQHSSSSIRQRHVLYLSAISVTGCFYLSCSSPPLVLFAQEKFLNEVRDFDWQAPPMKFIIKTSPVIVIIVPREWTEFYIKQLMTQSLEWTQLLSILTHISQFAENCMIYLWHLF